MSVLCNYASILHLYDPYFYVLVPAFISLLLTLNPYFVALHPELTCEFTAFST